MVEIHFLKMLKANLGKTEITTKIRSNWTLNFQFERPCFKRVCLKRFGLFQWFGFTIVLSRSPSSSSWQMAVCIVDKRGDTQKESCSLADTNGINRRFKAITKVHRTSWDKALVLWSSLRLQAVLFFANRWHHRSVYWCLFDHERLLRKRQRLSLANAAMAEDCTRRPCEIVRMMKEAVSLTLREEASLTQFVQKKTSRPQNNFRKAWTDLSSRTSWNIYFLETMTLATLFLLDESSLEEPHKDGFAVFFKMLRKLFTMSRISSSRHYRLNPHLLSSSTTSEQQRQVVVRFHTDTSWQ